MHVNKSNRLADVTKLFRYKEERDVAKANAIRIYAKQSASGKVDFICRNYPNFIGIVDGYTEGLKYMIEEEKALTARNAVGDTGVRVQKSGLSDPTAKKAINNVITRDAIIDCDFSGGVLDGVQDPDRYMRDADILKQMRKHYALFNEQMKSLQKNEYDFFLAYLLREKKLIELADEEGIGYDSLCQKANKTKKKVKVLMVGFLEGEY